MDKESRVNPNAGILRVTKFTRRHFLKRAGVAAAGATIGAIAFAASCKSPVSITAGTTTADDTTAPTNPSDTTTSNPPTLNTTATVSTYSYSPPTILPPIITVTGTTCVVATDRSYSADHIWVKSISASTNVSVMGITTTLDEILYEPFKISLPKVGDKLAAGNAFGSIEGYKMTADLLTPVSGTVIEINDFLNSLMMQGTVLEPVINDPYNSGWMVVVQLSKPGELTALLTAQAYRDLVAHS